MSEEKRETIEKISQCYDQMSDENKTRPGQNSPQPRTARKIDTQEDTTKMAEQIMWKAQAVIESEGKKLLIHAAGPAENIYIALGHAKACIAKEYPKIDTGKIKIN